MMAQTYAAAIKWPKDKILEVRLRHVMHCVEKDEWPVDRDYALSDHLLKEDEDDEALFAALLAQASAANASTANSDTPRDTSTPMSESSEVSFDNDPNVLTHGKRSGQRRGRRPLDYSDDRSKIRSLLQQPTLSESDDARYIS